ncbi:hypothetical protein GCM10027167_75610 [Nocardia heshunensis]
MQARFGDPEILGDLLDRRVALAGDRDDIAAELLRIRLRHGGHPSSEDEVLTDQESTKPGAVPYEFGVAFGAVLEGVEGYYRPLVGDYFKGGAGGAVGHEHGSGGGAHGA